MASFQFAIAQKKNLAIAKGNDVILLMSTMLWISERRHSSRLRRSEMSIWIKRTTDPENGICLPRRMAFCFFFRKEHTAILLEKNYKIGFCAFVVLDCIVSQWRLIKRVGGVCSAQKSLFSPNNIQWARVRFETEWNYRKSATINKTIDSKQFVLWQFHLNEV